MKQWHSEAGQKQLICYKEVLAKIDFNDKLISIKFNLNNNYVIGGY